MVRVGNVWKSFTVELACWLEDMWKHDNKKAHLKDYVHVRKLFVVFQTFNKYFK